MSVSIKLDSSANAQRSAPNRFFETLHSGFTIHMAYHYAISSFGNLAAVEHIIWSVASNITLSGADLWM